MFSSLDMCLVSSPSKAYTPTAVIVDVKKPCYMPEQHLKVSSAYSKLNAFPCESKQIRLLKHRRRLSLKEESEKGTLFEYFFVACSCSTLLTIATP